MNIVKEEIGEEHQIWKLMDSISDPEVPVVSVNDLGIVRDVIVHVPFKKIEIRITPTYSGCPAMDVIAMNIRLALIEKGYEEIQLTKVLSPVWTTEWMTEKGKMNLKAYGIAPPGRANLNNEVKLFASAVEVQCPLCNSYNTILISEFGSTACKSLYRCNDCSEPFDHFKCH